MPITNHVRCCLRTCPSKPFHLSQADAGLLHPEPESDDGSEQSGSDSDSEEGSESEQRDDDYHDPDHATELHARSPRRVARRHSTAARRQSAAPVITAPRKPMGATPADLRVVTLACPSLQRPSSQHPSFL
jgi:hypothetical protein